VQWNRPVYYRYNPPSVLLTDGAKHFAETCEAFWLLDLIASWQLEPENHRAA
jgi:hypothetical protein